MLKNKTRYALKALIELSQTRPGRPIRVEDIASRQIIPKKFLELILRDLRNMGLIESKKGKGGGYFLSPRGRQATVGEVIRFFEGPLALLPCASVTQYKVCEDCSTPESCAIQLVMRKVRDEMSKILDTTKFLTLGIETTKGTPAPKTEK